MLVHAAYTAFQVNTRSQVYPVGRTAYRPALRIVVSRGDRRVALLALVDSGADHSVFPLAVAFQLGLDVAAGRSLGTARLLGNAAPCYVFPVTLAVQDRFRLRCDVGFTEATHVALLGQCGFFDRLDRVTFFPQSHSFEIECSDRLAI